MFGVESAAGGPSCSSDDAGGPGGGGVLNDGWYCSVTGGLSCSPVATLLAFGLGGAPPAATAASATCLGCHAGALGTSVEAGGVASVVSRAWRSKHLAPNYNEIRVWCGGGEGGNWRSRKSFGGS
jgi:hypothetical protein